jgi:hypothetical protein
MSLKGSGTVTRIAREVLLEPFRATVLPGVTVAFEPRYTSAVVALVKEHDALRPKYEAGVTKMEPSVHADDVA